MTNEIYRMNTGALAYIGDAVYEVYVRKHILGKGNIHGDVLHKRSVKYVNAHAQEQIIRNLMDSLSDEEQALVKRARNRKISTKPKNTDPVTYKWATAFEALLGYYFLSDDHEKLNGTMERAVKIIDEG